MRIAIDAMGGDRAPKTIIEGAIESAKEYPYELILVGEEGILRSELEQYKRKYKKEFSSISIYNATQAIGMDELPGKACRQKRDASIMVATKLVADGLADAVVSAGNSGASMAAAVMLLQRIPGVSRPALATLMPTLEDLCVILDVGANVDCKPKNLLQFALMGNIYVKYIFNKELPRIGLLSIGEEESKGNELTLTAFELLKKSSLNFIGNVEGNDIPKGRADVVVCDGFVGNVLLKMGEGLVEVLFRLIKEGIRKSPIRTALTGLLLRSVFRDIKKKVDYDEYGGAPLLGVNGPCFICHGKSNAKAIKNAVRTAAEFVDKKVNQAITLEIERYQEILNGVKE